MHTDVNAIWTASHERRQHTPRVGVGAGRQRPELPPLDARTTRAEVAEGRRAVTGQSLLHLHICYIVMLVQSLSFSMVSVIVFAEKDVSIF